MTGGGGHGATGDALGDMVWGQVVQDGWWRGGVDTQLAAEARVRGSGAKYHWRPRGELAG